MTERVRVVVAEDELLIRKGLATVLSGSEFEIIEQVDTADELLAVLGSLLDKDHDEQAGGPQLLVITDIRMPPTHTHEGLDAAVETRRRWPWLPVCVLSQYVLAEPAKRFLGVTPGARTGGLGYMLKQRITEIDAFQASLRHVVAGGQLLDPEVVAELATRPGPAHAVATLPERQREVLMLLAEGLANAQIAERLHISERTVVMHCSRIYDALGLPVEAEGHRRVRAVLAWLERPVLPGGHREIGASAFEKAQ